MKEHNKFRTELAEVYIENGILHILMVNNDPTIADYRQHFAALKNHFGDIFPLPAVLRNPENSKPLSKELRDYMAGKEMAEVLSALAIINNSTIMRMTVNLFFKISRPCYPMQMFGTEEKALLWLREL